ncbi:MAG: LCP family protein, partial [Erysipelotrichaceae bacterium]|nr:LCP family protein [Erysipelotrichaceae bacterium]
MHVLPPLYFMAFILLLGGIFVWMIYGFQRGKNLGKLMALVLCAVLAVTGIIGNQYLNSTKNTLDEISGEPIVKDHSIELYIYKDSTVSLDDPDQNLRIGVLKYQYRNYVNLAISQLRDICSNLEIVECDTALMMDNMLQSHQIDAMLMDSHMLSIMQDEAKHKNLEKDIRSIYTYEYIVNNEEVLKPVDVTNEPFTVLISGSDSRKGIDETARSDSNMLVTVNPKEKILLMVSIPRDYYVQIDCDATMGCAAGEYDKLTHTGLYGTEVTEMTIEHLLSVEINYHARVCFSTLVNVVDALGGISVSNETTFRDRYDKYTFEEGVNHLDGDMALAYARERYAFASGDRQRGRNQMKVLSAIVRKAASPSIVTQYQDVLYAISDTFTTNMSTDEMMALVNLQLQDHSSWRIYSFSMDGQGASMPSIEYGSDVSVIEPDSQAVTQVRKDIRAVKNGQTPPYLNKKEKEK